MLFLSEEDSQMYRRYLRKRRRHIVFILSLVCLTLFWVNYRLSESLSEKVPGCEGPCVDPVCIHCRGVVIEEKVPNINIFEKLKLKKAFRVGTVPKEEIDPESDQVCRRPNFDLNHDSVRYAFHSMDRLNCSGESLFKAENGIFRIDYKVLKDRELVKCEFFGIERVSDDFSTYTEPYTKETKPFDLQIKQDFVRIKCFLKKNEDENSDLDKADEENVKPIDDTAGDNETTEINIEENYVSNLNYYDFYHSFEEPADFDQFIVQVYPRADVHKRISKVTKKLKNDTSKQSQLNVLMIGLDSMSHMSYQRKLPRTYRYLKDELGAVILNGYNIVGDATTAAVLPMLTGKSETELPEARKKYIQSDYVDRFPLIWNDYRDHGYATLFAEDEPSIGVFNLRLNGFEAQPTDHYMRPFWQSLWDSELRRSSPRFCTGDVPNHIFLLNYTRNFVDTYKNVSKFAFVFGSELTHWNNNPGEYMDTDFVDLMKYLQESGHLKNTVLVVFADHGARYSAVRKTVQGKLEERLPMMSFTFPDWFKEKYPILFKNLKENSDRLATPFDIYATLKHILHINKYKNRPEYSSKNRKMPRGISLLHPIPRNRTCAMAAIQLHWCTCLKQVEVHSNDVHVQKSVAAVLTMINKETEFVRSQCVQLTLKRVHSAFLLIPNEQVLMFQKTKDEDNRIANFSANVNIDHIHFQITMESLPNHGVFEATVQVNMTAGSYLVMDGVSRLDMYGNQPACVQDRYPDLRKFCFCRKTQTG